MNERQTKENSEEVRMTTLQKVLAECEDDQKDVLVEKSEINIEPSAKNLGEDKEETDYL